MVFWAVGAGDWGRRVFSRLEVAEELGLGGVIKRLSMNSSVREAAYDDVEGNT